MPRTKMDRKVTAKVKKGPRAEQRANKKKVAKQAKSKKLPRRSSDPLATSKPKSRGKSGAAAKHPKPTATQKPGSKRSRRKLGIRERLGQLTYHGACRLLDDQDRKVGEAKLRRGGKFEINLPRDARFVCDSFRVRVSDERVAGGFAEVIFVEMPNKDRGLHLNCDKCEVRCEHIAAALGLVLEEKSQLGLAAPPDPSESIENLTEDELIRRAIADRQERAGTEPMTLKSVDASQPWTEYTVASRLSGKTYHVSLRGLEHGTSYCNCPDFRTNHLGTCKHILFAQLRIKKRFRNQELNQPHAPTNYALRLAYGETLALLFVAPQPIDEQAAKLVGNFADKPTTNVAEVVRRIARLEEAGFSVYVYPDAEEFIDQRLQQQRLEKLAEEIRSDPRNHPLRKTLLKAELLPYQLDGIGFAVGAGRALLADDMGLGKTIQGIGVAELLAQQAEISRVLVVCPASVKSQWRSEILRFSDRSVQIVLGNGQERVAQYHGDAFFTICNYEQVLRDQPTIDRVDWDLIILDEGQRIKNWESKTSRMIKSLRSRFALVLSGTPLENRLEELYTVAGFIDASRLGPAYRFFHRHRLVDDRGKVTGYHNLDLLRESLKPILLRRTRSSVMQELPQRTTEIVRIEPTEEQSSMSAEYCAMAAQVAAKKFLTEMDLIRIQKFLLCARMACNSTYLITKEEPSYSSKLERLAELLEQLAGEPDRKMILFSEWTTMLNLIEPILERAGIRFVRLDGSVPQKKRQQLVWQFQNEADCRAIVMSNAGTTGLNLQAANTVVNIDLPWNPAILEQRIGRAHRMGQKNPVDVYLLVTEGTIEERMLETLSAKHDLALAALDINSNVRQVAMSSGIADLKKRLEQLVGPQPTAPIDASLQREAQQQAAITSTQLGETKLAERRDKIASAGGELLGAAMNLVGELVANDREPDRQVVEQLEKGLIDCTEPQSDGRLSLRLDLPNRESLNRLARTLASLLVNR